MTAFSVSADPATTHVCMVCGWVYDENLGDPANGVPPGTGWDQTPEGWLCPDCGVSKAEFEPTNI